MKVLIVIFFWFCSCGIFAKETSSLGLDYLKITKQPLLAEIMIDLEPKLIKLYIKHKLPEQMIKGGIRGLALGFRDDQVTKSNIEQMQKISPDSLLRLLELPKNNYPTLWAVGKLEKLNRELDSSLRLYKALNGKEY